MCPTHILKTSRGKGGATWADPRLAIAYAKFLSPAFHAWANRVVIERMEEEADPELAYSRGRDRAVRGWQKSGKSPEWIQQLKLQRGLRPNQPTRDGLDDIELLSVALSEAIAKRTIAFDKLACDRSCEQACRRSSEKVYAGVGDELRKSAARRGIAYDPNRN